MNKNNIHTNNNTTRNYNNILIAFIICVLFGSTEYAFADEAIKVPFQYAVGMTKFQTMCAACHGKWGEGSKQGPPLMHPFYKPSHHADIAFYRAILNGVKAHHWEFGDMPAIPGATREDADAIIPFIRWLQQEKGVY